MKPQSLLVITALCASIAHGESTEAAKQAASKELMKTPWVKDVFFSQGHANIGVVRSEKDWSAPMIGLYVNGILKKNGVTVQWVRFVDIKQVVYQKKSPRDAEIYKYACN